MLAQDPTPSKRFTVSASSRTMATALDTIAH